VPHRVYRFLPTLRQRMDEALGDDILSRQSLTLRDARHFGVPGDHIYLFVEGTDAGLLRADALLLDFGERAPGGDALYAMLKQEEDAAAVGLGSVFSEM
jgi:hypothetical protein